MDAVFFKEKKLSELNPREIRQLVREGELSSDQGQRLSTEIKTAKKIWQPIHGQISLKIFP